MGLISIAISIIGLIIGIAAAITVMNAAHMDLMPLWIGLTMGLAAGFAFLFNYKKPLPTSEEEAKRG